MKDAQLVVLVGIPGIGKSTLAQNIKWGFEKNGVKTEILCADSIRKELFGDETYQKGNKKVFEVLNHRMLKYLSEGKVVIHDCTNISSETRKNILKQISALRCRKDCIYFECDCEKAKTQNKSRKRNVPEYVIERMVKQWEKPTEEENFDNIWEAKWFLEFQKEEMTLECFYRTFFTECRDSFYEISHYEWFDVKFDPDKVCWADEEKARLATSYLIDELCESGYNRDFLLMEYKRAIFV